MASSTAVRVTDAVPFVEPAGMEIVVALSVYSPATADRVTVMSSSQAPLRAAEMVVALTRLSPVSARSQMVVGDGDMLTVARCFVSTWLPKSRTGYWVAFPKSQGSSLPSTPSTFTSQLA